MPAIKILEGPRLVSEDAAAYLTGLAAQADAEDDWRDQALCAQTDPEAFFPEKGGSVRDAKKVCKGCPVKDECLAYALENHERFGIWGGMSERERRRLGLKAKCKLCGAPLLDNASSVASHNRAKHPELPPSEPTTQVISKRYRQETRCRSGRHSWSNSQNFRIRSNGFRTCVPCETEAHEARMKRQQEAV